MLKQILFQSFHFGISQPPSGGCVLKRVSFAFMFLPFRAAAFGRLCVETRALMLSWQDLQQPPSGGCVLKLAEKNNPLNSYWQPPSGGCVLKPM